MPHKEHSHTERAWKVSSHKNILNFTSLVQQLPISCTLSPSCSIWS